MPQLDRGHLASADSAGTPTAAQSLEDDIHAGPSVAADGTLYVPTGTHLQAVGPDGVVKWTYDAFPLLDIRTTLRALAHKLVAFGP